MKIRQQKRHRSQRVWVNLIERVVYDQSIRVFPGIYHHPRGWTTKAPKVLTRKRNIK